jgi:uncharacterized protein YndB with AHSA1/START domain
MSFDHHATFQLPVSRERAFRALVEPAQLARWFAEHVRIEPRVGGAFTFHGRGVLGGDRAQTITAFEPGSLLAFRWTIHDVATEVRWRIGEGKDNDPSTSTLEIAHHVGGALPVRKPKHFIDDLWRYLAGNLAEHLGDGANVVLADLASDRPEIRLSIEIDAKPAKVFRALLEPELMNRWLYGAARVDVARREYSYGWSYDIEGKKVAGGPTRILELVENEKLVTDWPDWRGDPDKPPTRVTWLLEPLAGGARTKVTIVHAGFEHAVDRSDYQQGWSGFAENLAKVTAELG